MSASQHPGTQANRQRVAVACRLALVEGGARAFLSMLADITAQGDADLELLAGAEQGSKDTRDYRRMCETVRTALQRNLSEAAGAHAEGFVRALTHLLSLVGDGAGPGEGWDPIHATGAAFEDSAQADQLRIDWQRILANLQAAGMSMQEIAGECEISTSMLEGLARVGDSAVPDRWTWQYRAGHCLVALWCTRCGTHLRDVPIVEADADPEAAPNLELQ